MPNDESHLNHFKALLKDNASSKAFAPLAEGYRKLGHVEKALQIALEGVAQNPDFNSGKVALAHVFIDLKKYDNALNLLQEVITKDFYNLLAHKLVGKTYLYKNEPLKALQSYKSALLANPLDQLAAKMVSKLESLSIEDFSPALFSDEDLSSSTQEKRILKKQNASINSTLAYIDALITKNNYDLAEHNINDSLLRFPNNTQLKRRLSYLEGLRSNAHNISRDEALSRPEVTRIKINFLKEALANIEKHLEQKTYNTHKNGEPK